MTTKHIEIPNQLAPTICHERLPSTAHSHAQLLVWQGQTGNQIESKSWKKIKKKVFQNIHYIVETGTSCLSITGFQGGFPTTKLWAQLEGSHMNPGWLQKLKMALDNQLVYRCSLTSRFDISMNHMALPSSPHSAFITWQRTHHRYHWI